MMTDVLTEMQLVATGLSTAEYLAGDWPPNSQLIDGDVIVSSPRLRHQRLVGRFFYELTTWVNAGKGRGEAGIGADWMGPLDGHVYVPDVWWVTEERRPEDVVAVEWFPDLVIEVRSPGTWSIDRGRKREIYELGDTRELWLVDTVANRVLVDRKPAPGSPFERVAEPGVGELLTTPLLPGLALDLSVAFDR